LIAEGVSAGEFREVDPRQTAFTMLGAAAFYFASAPVMRTIVGHDLLAANALEKTLQLSNCHGNSALAIDDGRR